MANFNLESVKILRERLGTGMVDTKNALVEADGDIERAVEILRLKGAKGNAKRADRSTSEGLVAAKVIGNTAYLLELACETERGLVLEVVEQPLREHDQALETRADFAKQRASCRVIGQVERTLFDRAAGVFALESTGPFVDHVRMIDVDPHERARQHEPIGAGVEACGQVEHDIGSPSGCLDQQAIDQHSSRDDRPSAADSPTELEHGVHVWTREVASEPIVEQRVDSGRLVGSGRRRPAGGVLHSVELDHRLHEHSPAPSTICRESEERRENSYGPTAQV